MNKYSIFHPLVLSFYSKPLYQDVARNWRGTGFLYLLLLLALCWLPQMIQLHQHLAELVDQEAPPLVSQLPAITIVDGELSTDVDTPYFIRDPEKGTVLAIIDLTGEYTSLDNSEARLLLTRTKAIVRNRPRETRVYDLSGVGSFSLDRETVSGWLEVAKDWLAIVLYPFALLFSYLYRIVQVLLYAAIGVLVARHLKVALGYSALLRVTAVAITPVVLLDTVRSLTEVQIPLWWPICFAIAMAYLFFAVKANAEPAPAVPEAIA